MNWTKIPPAKPGAYWWKQRPDQCSFLVERFKDGTYRMAGTGIIYNVQMLETGEWCGPLVPVEEVEKAYFEGYSASGVKNDSYWQSSRARKIVEGEQVCLTINVVNSMMIGQNIFVLIVHCGNELLERKQV